jgi:hypothetical protein
LIRTDYYSLKFFLDQKLAAIPQHQWVSKLLGFDFRVEYKTGITNVTTDAMSRRDSAAKPSMMALSVPSFALFDDLRCAFTTDPALHTLWDKVQQGVHDDKWRVTDGLVMVDDQVYVFAGSPSPHGVILSAHGALHMGISKMMHRLRVDFHIPRAGAAVQDFMRACLVCQCNKTEHLQPAGLLRPLELPTVVWAKHGMDFIEGLPCVNGKSV